MRDTRAPCAPSKRKHLRSVLDHRIERDSIDHSLAFGYRRRVTTRDGPSLVQLTYESLRQIRKTVCWLLMIMVPASFVVFWLDRWGVQAALAGWLAPALETIGLPGAAAVTLVSSFTVNLYAAIATLPALELTQRQLVILATFCLIAHSLIVEVAVTKRTGTPALRMVSVRLMSGLLAAWLLHMVLPSAGAWGRPVARLATIAAGNAPLLRDWLHATAVLVVRVSLIGSALVYGTRVFRHLGVLDWIAHRMALVTGLLGLPRSTATTWLIANTLGLTYGAGVLIDEVDSGRLSRADSDLLNHSMGIAHALLEDTLLFAVLGAPALWLVVPRLIIASAVVWERRGERYLRLRNAAARVR